MLGIIHLKDIVKGGIRERFAELRRMGIRTVMITGDNPMTAAAIAAEAGVDDFLAQATPEEKLRLIRDEQGLRRKQTARERLLFLYDQRPKIEAFLIHDDPLQRSDLAVIASHDVGAQVEV